MITPPVLRLLVALAATAIVAGCASRRTEPATSRSALASTASTRTTGSYAQPRLDFGSTRDVSNNIPILANDKEVVLRVQNTPGGTGTGLAWALLGRTKDSSDSSTASARWGHENAENSYEPLFYIDYGWGYFIGEWSPPEPSRLIIPVWPVVRTKRVKIYASGTSFIVQAHYSGGDVRHRVYFLCPQEGHCLKVELVDDDDNRTADIILHGGNGNPNPNPPANTYEAYIGTEFTYIDVPDSSIDPKKLGDYVHAIEHNSPAYEFVAAIKLRVENFALPWTQGCNLPAPRHR